jgi:hypothetical protein
VARRRSRASSTAGGSGGSGGGSARLSRTKSAPASAAAAGVPPLPLSPDECNGGGGGGGVAAPGTPRLLALRRVWEALESPPGAERASVGRRVLVGALADALAADESLPPLLLGARARRDGDAGGAMRAALRAARCDAGSDGDEDAALSWGEFAAAFGGVAA